jgi:hypothetical protein
MIDDQPQDVLTDGDITTVMAGGTQGSPASASVQDTDGTDTTDADGTDGDATDADGTDQ